MITSLQFHCMYLVFCFTGQLMCDDEVIRYSEDLSVRFSDGNYNLEIPIPQTFMAVASTGIVYSTVLRYKLCKLCLWWLTQHINQIQTVQVVLITIRTAQKSDTNCASCAYDNWHNTEVRYKLCKLCLWQLTRLRSKMQTVQVVLMTTDPAQK